MDNKNYSFEKLWKDLNCGYQIYYTYLGTRYLLTKLDKNCYSKEIVKYERKRPSSKNSNYYTKKCKRNTPFYGRYRV